MTQQPLATAMTMAVIAVALALPLLLSVVLDNSRAATAGWNQAFDMSVYLDKKAAPSRAQTLAKQLRTRSDVAAVRVIAADEALAQFRGVSGFGSALDGMPDNPLPDTLVVTPTAMASNASGLQTLQTDLAATPDVHTVQADTEWVKRLQAILDILRKLIFSITVLLGLGVVLVIGNTVRLDILNRRAEIEVMKLVGATDGFARRPFLYSGVWYGLGGGIGALCLEGSCVLLMAAPAGRLAALYGSQFQLRGLGVERGFVVLVTAMTLGWLGSWLAASRHIKAIEPS